MRTTKRPRQQKLAPESHSALIVCSRTEIADMGTLAVMIRDIRSSETSAKSPVAMEFDPLNVGDERTASALRS